MYGIEQKKFTWSNFITLWSLNRHTLIPNISHRDPEQTRFFPWSCRFRIGFSESTTVWTTSRFLLANAKNSTKGSLSYETSTTYSFSRWEEVPWIYRKRYLLCQKYFGSLQMEICKTANTVSKNTQKLRATVGSHCCFSIFSVIFVIYLHECLQYCCALHCLCTKRKTTT